MNKFLAVECATDICSVALEFEGEISQLSSDETRSNARLILPMVDELLCSKGISIHDLDGLNINVGPGSFTGIRIGISIVQGLAYGARLPVYTWNTLEIMAGARQLKHKEETCPLIVALDARMGEVYWAQYQLHQSSGLSKNIHEPGVSSIEDFEKYLSKEFQPRDFIGLGSGFSLVNRSSGTIFQEVLPQAKTMLELLPDYMGSRELLSDGAGLTPLYLRNEVAWKKRERKRIREE